MDFNSVFNVNGTYMLNFYFKNVLFLTWYVNAFFCTAIFFVTLSCLNANGFFGNIVKEKSPIRWQNMSTVGYRKKGGGWEGQIV